MPSCPLLFLKNFNPRPPWGGRHGTEICNLDGVYFNPRPPWGGRQKRTMSRSRLMLFQSTPSVGRATILFTPKKTGLKFQSTPSVGRATTRASMSSTLLSFQSTPSVGRATDVGRSLKSSSTISIHALRGEGDRSTSSLTTARRYFNPRPPWGGRLSHSRRAEIACQFQSTPSVGRATQAEMAAVYRRGHFNPRPPWGGRQFCRCHKADGQHFNPRPPWGGRQKLETLSTLPPTISIHALRGEGDIVG